MEVTRSETRKGNLWPATLTVPAISLLILVVFQAIIWDPTRIGALWLVALAAVAIPCLLLVTGMLPFLPNILFYAIYFEVFVYLFAAPLLYASDMFAGDSDTLGFYRFVEVGVLLLFVPALILGYLYFAPRPFPLTGIKYRPPLKINQIRRLMLILLAISLPVGYLYVLADADLLFRRIGHQALANAFLALPRTSYLIIRVFDRLALPLVCVLLILVWQPQPRLHRVLTSVALLATGGTYLLVSVLNSRLQVVQFVLIALVVALFWSRKHITLSGKLAIRLVAAGLFALYLLNVTLAVRELLPKGELSLAALNPFRETATAPFSSAALRLNCIDLMAQITPPAQRAGYSLGAAWVPSIVITFGQFVDPDTVNQYKQELATAPKYYLMLDYLGVSVADYPSCILTDAYGNLGPMGMLVAGLVFGILVALALKWLAMPVASWQLPLGLVLLPLTTRFEGDFISVLLDWIPYAPVIFLLLVLNPFRISQAPREATQSPGS